MKILLFFFVSVGLCSAELSDQQQKTIATAEKSQVELRLDQPYAGNDNPKQKVDLYLPKTRNNDKPLPVVALIHGGGWVNGDRLGYASAAIQFARTGDYASVAVGYRLTKEAHWPAQVYDCKAAIRWIRAHAKEYNLDPDKIAVMGSSAGGHLSSLIGTSGDVKELEGDLGPNTAFSSRVQCVVNLCGPEDFTQALMFDKEKKPVLKDDAVIGLLGGNYEEKHAEAVAVLAKQSPPHLSPTSPKTTRPSSPSTAPPINALPFSTLKPSMPRCKKPASPHCSSPSPAVATVPSVIPKSLPVPNSSSAKPCAAPMPPSTPRQFPRCPK